MNKGVQNNDGWADRMVKENKIYICSEVLSKQDLKTFGAEKVEQLTPEQKNTFGNFLNL